MYASQVWWGRRENSYQTPVEKQQTWVCFTRSWVSSYLFVRFGRSGLFLLSSSSLFFFFWETSLYFILFANLYWVQRFLKCVITTKPAVILMYSPINSFSVFFKIFLSFFLAASGLSVGACDIFRCRAGWVVTVCRLRCPGRVGS